jgi:hypothetical protein
MLYIKTELREGRYNSIRSKEEIMKRVEERLACTDQQLQTNKASAGELYIL